MSNSDFSDVLAGRRPPTWLELNSVIPLHKKTDPTATTATRITSLSAATIRRRWPDKIRQLTDKREGIRLADALEIAGVKPP